MVLKVLGASYRKSPEFEDLPVLEQKRLQTLFKQLDVDHDDRITPADLAAAFSQMDKPVDNNGCIQTIVQKKGSLDFEGFYHFILDAEQELMKLFKRMDENKDGMIDTNEIVKAFARQGVKLDPQEAFTLLKRMDKDDSETITFNEWRDYLLFLPSFELHDILKTWRHSTFLDLGENALVPEDFTETEMQSGMWWRHLVAGGVAGAVSRTCTAPLDRIKVFFQVRGAEYNSMSVCLKYMLKEGGVYSLWRGNGINVMKIAPESALKFMAYEQAKAFIRGKSDKELKLSERFVAGSIAGAFSQTAIYPMEVLKTRLALRTTGQYTSIWDAARKIYRREGARTFYRGYIPNLMGIIPYAGIDLAVYETMKKRYIQKHPEEKKPRMYVLLGCGALSSSCGQLASYPLALVRTRLQAQVATSKDKKIDATMIQLFRAIIKKEGFSGLYRGITPNFIKVAPAVSISYVVYEHSRRALGVSTI